MNTLFAKILLWFWATLFIFVVGAALISALSADISDRHFPMARLVSFELVEARHAYETNGRPGLEAFMQRLHSVYHGDAYRRYRERVPALFPLPWRYLSRSEAERLAP